MTTLNLYVGARLTAERAVQTAGNLCWAGWYLTERAVEVTCDGFAWIARTPARRRAARRRVEWECTQGLRDWPDTTPWDRRIFSAARTTVRWTIRETVSLGLPTLGAFVFGAAFTLADPLGRAALIAAALAAIPAVLFVRGARHFRQEATALRQHREWAAFRDTLTGVDLDRDHGADFVVLRDAKPPIQGAGATTGLLDMPETPEHTWEVA